MYLARALTWRDRREHDKALADCDAALRLNPENPDAYAIRAGLRTDKAEHDLAIADYSRVIKLDPGNAWAYCSRGLAWFEKRDYDKAIVDLDRSIRLDPGSPWSYSNRGMVWYEKKAYDKAVADLDRALGLDPDNADALNGRAWIWATCAAAKYRDGKQAVALATRASERTEWKEPGVLDTLAASYAESGDFDAAVKWQTKANAMFPEGKEKSEGAARLKLYQARKPYRENTP